MIAEIFIEVIDSEFPLGQLVTSPHVLDEVPHAEVYSALRRHASGDWGELDAHDKAVNEAALGNGDRLFSVYTSGTGIKFWIISEADRSATTVLLPEDY